MEKKVERHGFDETRLWNTHRNAVEKCLQAASYGDVAKKAAVAVDEALYVTSVSGRAAFADKREAVQYVKVVVVERAAEGVKLAVGRLYEAAAKILQLLKEHWKALALVAAAAAASLITRFVTQHIDHTLFVDHAAWLASKGFLFGRAEVERREVASEVAKALDELKKMADLARQGKSADPAEERRIGKEVAEAVKKLLKLREEGPGFFKKAGKAPGEILNSLNAPQLKDWIIAKALGGELRPIGKTTLAGERYLHVLTKEEREAFNADVAAGFWYKAPDVRVGNAEARGVFVLVFKSGETVLRVEVLARKVQGFDAERVKTSRGELYRVASLSASVKRRGGKVKSMTLAINLEMERLDPAHFYVSSLDPREAEGARHGLYLTDVGVEKRRRRAKYDSPDVATHMFVLSVFTSEQDWNDPNKPRPVVYLSRARYTEQGLDVELETRISNVTMPTKSEVWKALSEVREALRQAVAEAENTLLANGNRFKAAFEKIKEVLRQKPVLAPIADHLDNPGFWLAFFLGDGNVDVERSKLGYSVHRAYLGEAELLLRIFALAYGESAREKITRGVEALYFHEDLSKLLAKRLFDSLSERTREVLAEIVNRWYDWGMPGGSDPPKLVKLIALYEAAGGRLNLRRSAKVVAVEYEDAVYRRALEEMPHVRAVGEKAYVVRTFVEAEEGREVFKIEFAYPTAAGRWELYHFVDKGGEYHVECAASPCRGAAELAKELKARVKGKKYELGAGEGKALRYLLTRRHQLSIALGGKDEKRPWMDKARVEVLEVRENGDVTIRIWFYRWFETRPNQPFVDVEIRYDESFGGFIGWLHANREKGIYREHLAGLYQLFEREGLPVTPKYRGNEIKELIFYGGFRSELLRRIGYQPEPVAAEPVAVEHLGGLVFKVGGRVVKFAESKEPGESLKTVLQFDNVNEAVEFYRRLKAAGVYADMKGSEIRLNDESYWGIVIASGKVPEGWQLVYPLEGDEYRDLYLFKREGEKGVYYQFVVKVSGVWRAAGNWYEERAVTLQHSDRAVLEALREAAKRAIGAELGKIGEKEGAYRIRVTRPVLDAFETRAPAAKSSEMPALDVEGDFIVVKHGGVEHRVEFELVKRTEGVVVDSSLRPALEALGVPFTWTPEGLKLERDGMWGLLAAAVKAREENLTLPNGVSLIGARDDREHYIFRVDAEDGQYVYSVLRVGGVWTAMGGKVRKDGSVIMQHSDEKVVRAHAEAHNELLARCIDEGRCKPKEPKWSKGAWFFHLNKTDQEELGRKL